MLLLSHRQKKRLGVVGSAEGKEKEGEIISSCPSEHVSHCIGKSHDVTLAPVSLS